jgi:nucleotide-binding universal stress UspA family protein
MRYPIFHPLLPPEMKSDELPHGARAAFDVATQLDGQVTAVIGALTMAPPNILGSSMVSSLVASENKRHKDAAEAARERIEQFAKSAGVTIHTEVISDELLTLAKRMANRARLHGLVIAERGVAGELYSNELIEPLLFGSGRPVLVVPHGHASPLSFERALIAWDGGLNAARAVWDSVPLLRLAESIEIVTVVGEKDLGTAPAANSLAPMLAFLGAETNVAALELGDESAAQLIKRHAAKVGASFIVQGAYGRSRWAEMVLGGVTREMLHNSQIPALMSH